MKRIFIWVIVLSIAFNSNAQDSIDYKAIDSIGKALTSRLQQGNIEYLKDSKPPENTWEYSRLVEFKNALKDNTDTIIFGSFIEPSTDESYYGFNLFAYKRVDKSSFEYYFAAVVNIDISNSEYKLNNAYLFTEKGALKNWWMHVFGFYEGEKSKQIPKEYLFPLCPPPPFK